MLHRSGNRYYPVGHGRYTGEHIPGARYVELPGEDDHELKGVPGEWRLYAVKP